MKKACVNYFQPVDFKTKQYLVLLTNKKTRMPLGHHYAETERLANAIEAELKRLARWSADPLPAEAYENMGAFGCNTMAFEQWIQFMLLPRLRHIIAAQDEFPAGSSLAPYAIRVFDGDPDAHELHNLLYQIDRLVEESESEETVAEPETIMLNSGKLPAVVYTLIDVLHEFEGEDLESQLQTYDTFLGICSQSVRPEMTALFLKAASKATNEITSKRIEAAAQSVLAGGRAAAPYNYEEAMGKYREEHQRNFPKAD
jgi:uncharacterized protein YqcC (DUF446 family)